MKRPWHRLERENLQMAGKLSVVVVAMLCFGYALQPLYKHICEALGINVLSLGENGGRRERPANTPSAATRIPCAASCRTARPPQP